MHKFTGTSVIYCLILTVSESSKSVGQSFCFKFSLLSTYAKVHGSVSVDALQRKETEESACGKVHDPAFKITEIYFQEKLVKNGNY